MKYLLLLFCLSFAAQASAQDAHPKPMVIYAYPEEQPKPSYDINKYLNENLHYPKEMRETGMSGRVMVKFIVTENGAIDSVKVVRGIGGGGDEEAMRVIKAMPPWLPGKQGGRPVNVYYTLPVSFVLQ